MIRVNFILKSKFLGSKAMGKAMNPHFPLATFRMQPHARLRQPTRPSRQVRVGDDRDARQTARKRPSR